MNYEILEDTFIFHSEDEEEPIEFELNQIIDELERVANNVIEERDGKLYEYLDWEEEHGYGFTNRKGWVSVESWQIEEAVDNLKQEA